MRGKKLFNLQDENGICSVRVPVLISACLLGIHCRYDGGHSLCSPLVHFLSRIHGIPVCPEQLGGLSTPRPAANIIGGDGADVLRGKAKLINELKQDVTGAFLRGAEETIKIAEITGAHICITKKKSPSCGLNTPYCDTTTQKGLGVTAALMLEKGFDVWELDSGDDFPTPEFLELLKKYQT